jgi:CRP-like cAMP-binding protein
LDGAENSFTAIAGKKCITWCIAHQRFLPLIAKYPVLVLSLLNVLVKRNRRLIENYEDRSSRPVKARTATIILDLSSNGSRPVERITHSNQFLAARISTVPEAVRCSLNYLRESGVISCKRTQIFVTCPEKLAELAQVDQD